MDLKLDNDYQSLRSRMLFQRKSSADSSGGKSFHAMNLHNSRESVGTELHFADIAFQSEYMSNSLKETKPGLVNPKDAISRGPFL